MLADVNIDLEASFLPNAKSMASFARASPRSKGTTFKNAPLAIKAAKPNITNPRERDCLESRR